MNSWKTLGLKVSCYRMDVLKDLSLLYKSTPYCPGQKFITVLEILNSFLIYDPILIHEALENAELPT